MLFIVTFLLGFINVRHWLVCYRHNPVRSIRSMTRLVVERCANREAVLTGLRFLHMFYPVSSGGVKVAACLFLGQ